MEHLSIKSIIYVFLLFFLALQKLLDCTDYLHVLLHFIERTQDALWSEPSWLSCSQIEALRAELSLTQPNSDCLQQMKFIKRIYTYQIKPDWSSITMFDHFKTQTSLHSHKSITQYLSLLYIYHSLSYSILWGHFCGLGCLPCLQHGSVLCRPHKYSPRLKITFRQADHHFPPKTVNEFLTSTWGEY